MNLHLSPNRLEGSLCDTSLDRLLGACRKHLVTGAIQVTAGSRTGTIELRAGAVDAAVFGMAHGERAVELMAALPDGLYELTQKLPDLDGGLGTAAVLVAGGDMSLVKVLRHCEHHALSCTIVMVSAGRRGEIEYRAGEIARAACAGLADIDAIVEMKGWADARIEVVALPLDLGIEGWPRLGRAPTAPFTLGREHPRPTTSRIARGTGAVDSVDTAPAKDPHDESGRRKATVIAPAPAPRNPKPSLPRPRKALPPSSAAAPPAALAEPPPVARTGPRAEPTPVPLRAPTAVRGSASSPGRAKAMASGSGSGSGSGKRRARTTPRVAEKRATEARPARDATAPVAPADILDSGPVPTLPTLATARANPTPTPTAPSAAPVATGRRARHTMSNPRAVEARQQAAAAAYRSPRPVARNLVPPPPPGRRVASRPPTRVHTGGRWALYAAIALTIALAAAMAIAAVTGVL